MCYLLEYSFIHAKCIHLIKSWVYTFLPSVNIHHIHFYSLQVYIIYILPSVGIHYIFTLCEYTLYTFYPLWVYIIYICPLQMYYIHFNPLWVYIIYILNPLWAYIIYIFCPPWTAFFFHFLHTGFRKKVLNFGKVESFHCLFNGCCFWPVCLLREDLMCLRLASDSLHSWGRPWLNSSAFSPCAEI